MIKVYSTPTCPWCTKVKSYLTSHNVDFDYVNVATDINERNEMIKLSGQAGVPVINIDGDIIIGFDKSALDSKLNL